MVSFSRGDSLTTPLTPLLSIWQVETATFKFSSYIHDANHNLSFMEKQYWLSPWGEFWITKHLRRCKYRNNLYNLFRTKIWKMKCINAATGSRWVELRLLMIFSIHCLLEMMQIKSDGFRTGEEDGSIKANIWIFYILFISAWNPYLPTNT